MAVKDTKALLKDMLKTVNDEYARKQVDKHTQVVTLELNNIVEAWKEGYANLLNKHSNNNFPEMNSINWVEGVTREWSSISKAITRNKGFIIEETSNVIVFKESAFTKNIHDTIKSFSVKYIQEQLQDYTLTDARAEVGKNPSLLYSAAAGLSDIGIIKKGQHRLHKGSTSVGAARLVLSMKWISKTRFFKDFTSSKQAKKLEEVYGDIFLAFETTGSKKKGLKLDIKEDIKISLGAGASNPTGGEPTDWKGNLEQALKKALLNWAKNAELAGRPGSSSIEDNAVNAVTYNTVKELGKVKGAKVTTSATSKTRKPKKVPVLSKYKSLKSSKRAKAISPKTQKSRAKKGVSSTPLYLIGVMNEQLPRVIQKNMDDPHLNYRTGRFAASVKVTDVTQTAKGFPSIGYTYMKSPYQTFETGFAKGSVDRDPRKLIEKSMREIAAGLAIGRFYTRRV